MQKKNTGLFHRTHQPLSTKLFQTSNTRQENLHSKRINELIHRQDWPMQNKFSQLNQYKYFHDVAHLTKKENINEALPRKIDQKKSKATCQYKPEQTKMHSIDELISDATS